MVYIQSIKQFSQRIDSCTIWYKTCVVISESSAESDHLELQVRFNLERTVELNCDTSSKCISRTTAIYAHAKCELLGLTAHCVLF